MHNYGTLTVGRAHGALIERRRGIYVLTYNNNMLILINPNYLDMSILFCNFVP